MGNITKWRIFSTLLWPFIIKGHYLFSKTPFEITTPAPSLGKDNSRIYGNLLGLTKENLTLLKQAHVV